VPYFFPALRPEFETMFKAGAKLFLEAELGADDAVADRLVDAAVSALFQATAGGTDEECRRKAEGQINRFLSLAHDNARERGWDEAYTRQRYERRLQKVKKALERARDRAVPHQQGAALAHALEALARERAV
jgi:hypothetical protein